MIERNLLIRLWPALGAGRSAAWRYGMAILTSLFCIGIRWLLGFVIGYDAPFAFLFLGIALSAFFGGLGPGLAAILTSLSLADYFLVPPLYTVGLPGTTWVISSLVFAVSGMVVCVLADQGRSAVLQLADEAEVRRVAQENAQLTEERLRIAEEVMAGGVWDWDIPSGQIYWSPGYRRLFDYPMDVAPSREAWVQSVHPEDRQRVLDFLQGLFSDKRHLSAVEYRIQTASRRVRWLSSYGRVYYDAAGQPKRMVGVNLDITARRLMEEEVNSDQTKMRLLMQYARVGDWEWTPADGSVKCSPEFYEVLGVDPSEPPTFDRLMAHVHPGDDLRIRELLDRLTTQPGQDFDFENRYIDSQGRERVLHTRGTVLRDEHGNVSRVVGITIDIARKRELLPS